jgi:hypothetical protein
MRKKDGFIDCPVFKKIHKKPGKTLMPPDLVDLLLEDIGLKDEEGEEEDADGMLTVYF